MQSVSGPVKLVGFKVCPQAAAVAKRAKCSINVFCIASCVQVKVARPLQQKTPPPAINFLLPGQNKLPQPLRKASCPRRLTLPTRVVPLLNARDCAS